MPINRSFRRRLARRLLEIAAAAAPLVAGCAGSSTEGCEPALGARFGVCFAPPDAGAGCPSGDAAGAGIVAAAQAAHPAFSGYFELEDGPTAADGFCCYTIRERFLCEGRPYLVADRALTAPARRAAGWADAESLLPRVEHLGPEARAALAAAWTRDGLFEHASVASFGRFALELLAVGAPAELVELAHRAALDEVRHARLCLGLASAYAGEPVAPSAFPFAGRVEVTSDLADVAARAAREGCIEETRAALDAAQRFVCADDPAVRAVLAIIAEDEARHAQLAWRTVAWAVRAGGEPVRARVAETFRCADPTLADVVAPAARALLGG